MIIKKVSIASKDSHLIVLKNKNIELQLIDIGATVYSLKTRDRKDKLENIVLQYEDINLYAKNPSYYGASIGRVAGRIKNGEISLDGKKYHLNTNENAKNTLHGGKNNISDQQFDYKEIAENKVEFSHIQKSETDGFPADINIKITYELLENAIVIYYDAIANDDTVLNLTNHNYYNLSGDYKTTIENHILNVPSSRFVKTDHNQAPYEIIDLPKQMLFDNCKISKNLDTNCEYLSNGGIDHCYLVDGVIKLEDPVNGRIMKVSSSYPAVQIYTTNYPDKLTLSTGRESKKYDAICFEPQIVGAFDGDYTNHPMRLDKGEKYNHFIKLEF